MQTGVPLWTVAGEVPVIVAPDAASKPEGREHTVRLGSAVGRARPIVLSSQANIACSGATAPNL